VVVVAGWVSSVVFIARGGDGLTADVYGTCGNTKKWNQQSLSIPHCGMLKLCWFHFLWIASKAWWPLSKSNQWSLSLYTAGNDCWHSAWSCNTIGIYSAMGDWVWGPSSRVVHEPDQILVPPGWAKPTNYFMKALCLYSIKSPDRPPAITALW